MVTYTPKFIYKPCKFIEQREKFYYPNFTAGELPHTENLFAELDEISVHD